MVLTILPAGVHERCRVDASSGGSGEEDRAVLVASENAVTSTLATSLSSTTQGCDQALTAPHFTTSSLKFGMEHINFTNNSTEIKLKPKGNIIHLMQFLN